jgi:hypothetical protein
VLLLASGARLHAQDLTKLATDLATKLQAKKLERVTVVDFLDLDQKANKLTKFMTLQLQSALTEANLEVVDQGHIAELFDQMDKLSQGLIDPATARQLGKIAGTDVVIYGTVMVSSLSVRLDVSAIDLQTAKVVASGSASPKRFGMVDKLARQVEPEEESEAEEAAPSVRAASVSKAPTRVRSDRGFVFELKGCSLGGDAMTCMLTVTSEGRDRQLTLGNYRSRAWNEAGEEFAPDDLRVSNSQDDSCVRKQILRDVPTEVTLTFSKFGGDGSVVERLRLGWTEGTDCYVDRTADFEKIALSESAATYSKKTGGAAAAANAVGSKKGGGILGRLTDKILDTAATTLEKVIDKNAKKVTGEDDEDPPQP